MSRDAFLVQVSRGLERCVARLQGCDTSELQSFVRELAIIAGRDDALVPRRAPVDVRALAESAVARWQTGSLVEGEPVTIDADADLMMSVLGELLSNARKYARKQVLIRVRGRGDAVEIVVEDDGPGIPRGARVGRRFVRGPRSRGKPGFGVGIWLVRRICEAHGGHLRLVRRARGLRAVAVLRA